LIPTLNIGRRFYFDFFTSFIEYVFIDETKKDEFVKVYSTFDKIEGFECLYKLGKIITNQNVSYNPYKSSTKRKKKKKRRKKR